jgi:hypothetical protein
MMPTTSNPGQRARRLSLDIMIGVAAAVAVIVVILFMRPQQAEDEGGAPRPALQPMAREPLKLSERLRPRSNVEPAAPSDAQPNAAGNRITAHTSAGVAPSMLKPRAVPQINADASEPTPRPGVVTDLPPEAIDLEEASEDISALTKVAFGDPDPERRLAAVTLLSATEDPQVITVLARSLADQNEEVRMAALQALSDFTGEAIAVAIESALHDPSPDIRYEAVSMLAEVGTERARNAIRQALADPDDDVRFLAESVLEMRKAAGGGPHEPPVAAEEPLR